MSTQRHIVEQLPIYWNFDYARLGNFSLTTKTDRYMLKEALITHENETELPSHHFNQICKTVSFSKGNPYHTQLSFPYKAIPCSLPYAFYVDVSQAYYQIINAFGMEVSHREGRFCAFGSTKPPELFAQNKMVRALLVSGTMRKSKFTEWKDHDLHIRTFSNPNYAPGLRSAIYRTLHAIQSLVSNYSVYCHTDGFIVPSWRIGRVTQLLEGYGIEYSIKGEGITQIFGVGAYRIGGKRTANYQTTNLTIKENIRHDWREWWLRNFEKGKGLVT